MNSISRTCIFVSLVLVIVIDPRNSIVRLTSMMTSLHETMFSPEMMKTVRCAFSATVLGVVSLQGRVPLARVAKRLWRGKRSYFWSSRSTSTETITPIEIVDAIS